MHHIFPPCAALSPAARRFFERSGDAKREMVDLSQAGVNALRLKNSQAAASGCQAVQAELGSRVEDGEMGGVSVEWITPHQVDGPEVVLYLFGGAFVCGSPEDDVSISARLAHHLGRRVCAPRYRLAPEHPFPAARDDAMAVYRALTAADSRVILCGESAGGNLALGLVIGIAEADLAPPLSVALLSPWIDLSHSGDSHTALDGLDPTLSVELFLSPASQASARERTLHGFPLPSADLPLTFHCPRPSTAFHRRTLESTRPPRRPFHRSSPLYLRTCRPLSSQAPHATCS